MVNLKPETLYQAWRTALDLRTFNPEIDSAEELVFWQKWGPEIAGVIASLPSTDGLFGDED